LGNISQMYFDRSAFYSFPVCFIALIQAKGLSVFNSLMEMRKRLFGGYSPITVLS